MRQPAPRAKRGWRLSQITFVALMLALTALFVILGNWQVQRLQEKEALIARVEARLDQPAEPFPQPDLWPAMAPEGADYRPYTLTGRFDHSRTVLIFTNLDDPTGQYGGVGYWVMAPLEVDGGIVWVNRGFVPERMAETYAGGGTGPEGPVTITGVARRPEQPNMFTPGSDTAQGREWVRDPERLAAFLPEGAGPVAPVTIDQMAGEPGALPQGGETQVRFPNRHLEYAGTWYLFAIITPIMLGFWLWRQRRSNLAHRGQDN